jgi:hypothetical protein
MEISEERKFKKHTDLSYRTKTDLLYMRTSVQNQITYLLVRFYTAVILPSADSLKACDNYSFIHTTATSGSIQHWSYS